MSIENSCVKSTASCFSKEFHVFYHINLLLSSKWVCVRGNQIEEKLYVTYGFDLNFLEIFQGIFLCFFIKYLFTYIHLQEKADL